MARRQYEAFCDMYDSEEEPFSRIDICRFDVSKKSEDKESEIEYQKKLYLFIDNKTVERVNVVESAQHRELHKCTIMLAGDIS